MASTDENIQHPAGNWMARKLRLFNEESKTLFPPKTSNSRKSYKKYDTVYRLEFKEAPSYNPKDYQQKFEPKRETVQDVLFSGNLDSTQMFMNWKIPSRILDNPSQERIYSAVPSLSPAHKPENITRHATLPEIHLTNNLHNRPASQMSIKSRRIPSRTLGTPVNSARLYREQNPSAETWAMQAEKTNQAKKSISKALRTQDDQKYRMVGMIRKSLDPEGRKKVDEWLANATAKDRKMALKLFSTLENNNLPDTEKQIRIEGILQLIKRKDQGYGTHEINTHLKHLRLQDPETRATRWMHTTWHHLPQYRDNDPVANPSSMYTKPHEPTPYDFVIHPDWG